MSGCEIEEVAIARPASQLAVHGVLSATATTQVILLERTRNGSVSLVGSIFDVNNPFGGEPGIAVSDAVITLRAPSGALFVAREDKRTRLDGRGAGIYRFDLTGAQLQRQQPYRLSLTTATGEVLTAETTLPGGAAATVAQQRAFDRARDTVLVQWDPVPGARSYFVRIETPYGPRSFFTDSTRVRLPGELRNPELESVPHVFIPGFPQAITVSAADSNYYDWYRSHNDPISGTGLINRVSGGLGVFGSLVRIRYQELAVTAPQTAGVEGTFPFVGTQAERASTPYLNLELYVESRSARGDQADALSGQFERRPAFGEPPERFNGVLGTLKDGRIQLAFLGNWSARDTLELFTGEVRGDTIVGRYRGFGGIVRFIKQR